MIQKEPHFLQQECCESKRYDEKLDDEKLEGKLRGIQGDDEKLDDEKRDDEKLDDEKLEEKLRVNCDETPRDDPKEEYEENHVKD